MRPPLSKQSRGKSTLKSSRWSKILTHLEMRLPSGGHERRSRWSRAVSAPHFFAFFLPYKIFALFFLCSYQHRAATCLAATKKLGGEMRPSPNPLCLSQPLHRGLASATHPGPRTAKNKNHAASPTSHSLRGPGGVAQLGRPLQDTNHFCPLPNPLSNYQQAGVWR